MIGGNAVVGRGGNIDLQSGISATSSSGDILVHTSDSGETGKFIIILHLHVFHYDL